MPLKWKWQFWSFEVGGSGGADNSDEPFDLILSSYNFKIAQPFRFVYFDYYILINEVFLVIKRKWELRDCTCGLDGGDLAVVKKGLMAGCWDRRAECSLCWIWSVWREIWEGGFEWWRRIWFLRSETRWSLCCVCCASLFFVRERERKREREVFGGREMEGKWKPSWNTETDEGWVFLFFMGRVRLNLSILFLG